MEDQVSFRIHFVFNNATKMLFSFPARGWNRSWKMFYATLRDLVLYCHKDENGFRKSQSTECYANSIRINHSIALIAKDYTKRKFVFRLITSDCAEFLFETRYVGVLILDFFHFLIVFHL